jgi:hypothetical protein
MPGKTGGQEAAQARRWGQVMLKARRYRSVQRMANLELNAATNARNDEKVSARKPG